MPTLVDNQDPEDEETGRAPMHAKNPECSATVAKRVRREKGLRQEDLFDAPGRGGAVADASDASEITCSVIEEAEDSKLNASEITCRVIEEAGNAAPQHDNSRKLEMTSEVAAHTFASNTNGAA